ncbi:NUDIX domain-containing protein [Candidatus Woesebacteria bacterium]|nr:MAG: NUDIX domain-containing protein [Candidatus Woesebacteria bacterium]
MDYYNLPETVTFLVSQKAFIVEKGKLLLLRYPIKPNREYSGYWALPGGLLEIDEKLDSGLLREVKEETGLSVEIGKLVAVGDSYFENFVFANKKVTDVRIVQIGYECTLVGKIKVIISDEHMAFKWEKLDNLKDNKFTPDCVDLINKYTSLHTD